MLAADESISNIARAVGRDKSTVSRERQRHANRDGTYRPLTAQKRAEQSARTAHARTRKLSRPGPLRDYVEQGLQQRWSPQEIAYRLPQDQPDDPLMRVSAEFGRGRLVGTISISERPAEAEDRAVPGTGRAT